MPRNARRRICCCVTLFLPIGANGVVQKQILRSLCSHQDDYYDIQFTPASRFHFVVIFFACVQNSIDPRPVMSPTPNLDSFQPPNENGSRGTVTPTFTPTMPALACSMT